MANTQRRFHGLKRLKIRQSWNKYNLYNLSRALPAPTTMRTLFQQKWTAKASARAYHGEPIREKKWQRMFRGSMRSVVPMDPKYLARFDGSEQARGRGSGPDFKVKESERQAIPYTSMVFAPVERRLDTAIFRALFASSTRQARQFVIHGYVTVNGKKMIHPSYQLNPGDLFQVDQDQVMYATGASKDEDEREASLEEDRPMRKWSEANAASDKQDHDGDVDEANANADAEAEAESSTDTSNLTSANPPEDPVALEAAAEQAAEEATLAAKADLKSQRADLQSLIQQARAILSNPPDTMNAKRKQDLRDFQRSVRKTIARPSQSHIDDLTTKLDEITARLSPPSPTSPTVDKTKEIPTMSSQSLQEEANSLTSEQLVTLRNALTAARENPYDPSKTYATPWRPRNYMSAFAFIPRYLEVNQRICAAVYIRHPVARPGMAEVPTPFNPEVMGLVHSWYLRRG